MEWPLRSEGDSISWTVASFLDGVFEQSWHYGLFAGILGYVVLYHVSCWASPRIALFARHYELLSPGVQADWNSRLPSTVHAIASVIGVYYPALCSNRHLENRVLYFDDRLFVPHGVTGVGPVFFMALFVGYLLADAVVVILHRKEIEMPGVTMIHHGFACVSWCFALLLQTMQWYACFWLLAELSTPLANLRWYLAKTNVDSNSKLYLFVGSWLFSTFFVVRVLPIPPTLYIFWRHDAHEAMETGGKSMLLWWTIAIACNGLLQCYWWTLMLRAILKKCCFRREDRALRQD